MACACSGRGRLALCFLVVVLLVLVGWSGAATQSPSAADACQAGYHTAGGKLFRTYCGPASATVHVAGRTIAFRGGLCAFDGAFKVSVGTLLLASTGAVPSSFVLAVTAYADGTYRDGQDGGTVRVVVAYSSAGKPYGTYRDVVTLRGNMKRGTFSGRLLDNGERVTGSFSCR
jgi:hypothetical protein